MRLRQILRACSLRRLSSIMVLPASVEADRLTRFTAAAAALEDAQVAARREAAEALIGVADEWLHLLRAGCGY